MNDPTPLPAPAYVLSEDSFQSLQELSGQMFLIASMVFAATGEEEKILLRLPRSLLGQCLQGFANQLAEALESSRKAIHLHARPARTH
jgi:hypothetical protein